MGIGVPDDGTEWRGVANGREYGVLAVGSGFMPFEFGRAWVADIAPTLNAAAEQIVDHVTTTEHE